MPFSFHNWGRHASNFHIFIHQRWWDFFLPSTANISIISMILSDGENFKLPSIRMAWLKNRCHVFYQTKIRNFSHKIFIAKIISFCVPFIHYAAQFHSSKIFNRFSSACNNNKNFPEFWFSQWIVCLMCNFGTSPTESRFRNIPHLFHYVNCPSRGKSMEMWRIIQISSVLQLNTNWTSILKWCPLQVNQSKSFHRPEQSPLETQINHFQFTLQCLWLRAQEKQRTRKKILFWWISINHY